MFYWMQEKSLEKAKHLITQQKVALSLEKVSMDEDGAMTQKGLLIITIAGCASAECPDSAV